MCCTKLFVETSFENKTQTVVVGKVTALKLPARNDKKKTRKEIEQKSSFNKNWEASAKKTSRTNNQPAEYGRWLEGIIYTIILSLSRHVSRVTYFTYNKKEPLGSVLKRNNLNGSVCQL